MTNFEKYKKQIPELIYARCSECEFSKKKKEYAGLDCSGKMLLWLYEEYQEPTIDWSKVEVDTKILVSQDGDRWLKGHFAKYEDDEVCAWGKGQTSWTSTIQIAWKYAKLAEVE